MAENSRLSGYESKDTPSPMEIEERDDPDQLKPFISVPDPSNKVKHAMEKLIRSFYSWFVRFHKSFGCVS